MAIDIVERTVNGETEKRLQLSKAYYLRKIKETEWTKLRVFFRISTCRDSAWASPPRFYMGLCAGNSAPGVVASPAHFAGWWNRTTDDWNYDVSKGLGVFQNRSSYAGGRIGKFENGVETSGNGGFNSPNHYIKNIGQGHSVIGFVFRKGSPNWEFSAYCVYGSYDIDYTPDRFSDLINVADFGYFDLVDNANYRILGTYEPLGALAIDETTYGTLDTVCFSWLGEGAENAFEISDISVKRLE